MNKGLYEKWLGKENFRFHQKYIPPECIYGCNINGFVTILTKNIIHIFSFYTCKVVTFILLEVISYDINFNNEIRTWQIWISSIWIFTKPNLNCKKFWFLKWSFMKIGQKTFAGPLHLITFFGRFGLSWFFFVIK